MTPLICPDCGAVHKANRDCRIGEELAPAPKPPVPEVPVFSNYVIGYRWWRLDDWVLTPRTMGSPWRPGINTARCVTHTTNAWNDDARHLNAKHDDNSHEAPGADCECGLYANHRIPDTRRWDDSVDGVCVLGAVAARGRLRVHPKGFRAQHAQILALAIPKLLVSEQVNDALDRVAALYQVPVVPEDQLETEALKHGRPLPDSVLPDPPKPPTIRYEGTMTIETVPLLTGWLSDPATQVSGSGYTRQTVETFGGGSFTVELPEITWGMSTFGEKRPLSRYEILEALANSSETFSMGEILQALKSGNAWNPRQGPPKPKRPKK